MTFLPSSFSSFNIFIKILNGRWKIVEIINNGLPLINKKKLTLGDY